MKKSVRSVDEIMWAIILIILFVLGMIVVLRMIVFGIGVKMREGKEVPSSRVELAHDLKINPDETLPPAEVSEPTQQKFITSKESARIAEERGEIFLLIDLEEKNVKEGDWLEVYVASSIEKVSGEKKLIKKISYPENDNNFDKNKDTGEVVSALVKTTKDKLLVVNGGQQCVFEVNFYSETDTYESLTKKIDLAKNHIWVLE